MNRQNKFFSGLFIIILFFTGILFWSSSVYARDVPACNGYSKTTTEDEKTLTPFITPKLNVEIPGLIFKQPILNEKAIESTFLIDYLTAMYRFLIGASITIAIIMVMIGGFQYVLSAGGADASKAKTRISNATIGLVLLLSVYLILYTTNPKLTIYSVIPLENVKYVPFDFDDETLTDKDLKSGAPYEFKYFKGDCPVALTNAPVYKGEKPGNIKLNVPRRVEYHEEIKKQITGSTIQERVIKAVEATTKCHIHYENCGVATTNMYALAAKGEGYSDYCLKNTDVLHPCNINGISKGNIHKTTVDSIDYKRKTSYGLTVPQLLQGFYCGSVNKCKCTKWPEPCIKDKAEAAKKLASILKEVGWSPDWVDELEPGDYYTTVNWNPSCPSTHAAMFLGWQNPASRTAWVEMADSTHFLRIGTIQFDNEDIVLTISRPKD